MTDSADGSGDTLDLERGSQLLERLRELNAQSSTAQAEAAAIAGRLAGSGLVEQLEGLPLEQVLIVQSRQRGSDARFQITCGEVLAHMPVTAGLLAAGQLSFSVVREIVWQVRSFGAAVRGQVDQRLAATVHEHGDLTAMDPDRLLWAVEQAVVDCRRPDLVERTAKRRRRANYVAVQADLDGGIRGHFSFDALTGAIVLGALDDAAEHISRANRDDDGGASGDGGDAGPGQKPGASAGSPHDGDGDGADSEDDREDGGEADSDGDGGDGGWRPDTGRGRQLGAALERMARCWMDGGRDAQGRAKTLVVVHVQAGDVTVNAAGQVELNVRGALPTITLAALERLTTDATLRTVIFDGARPLAMGRKVNADRLPADIRQAVLLRDRGCRFPGSPDPVGFCDVHHTHHQEDGGDHHPDRLVSLSRRFHTLSHKHGWTLTVDPDSGAVTASRRGRSYTSLPPGTPLSRPPQRPPDPPAGRPADRHPDRHPDRPSDRRPRGQPDTPTRPATRPPTRTGDPPRGDPATPATGSDDPLPF